jgi:hypothetical protein
VIDPNKSTSERRNFLLPRPRSEIVLVLELVLVLDAVFRRRDEFRYALSKRRVSRGRHTIDNDNDEDDNDFLGGRPYILRRRMA